VARVLVTEADGRNVVSVVRSLGRKGIEVVAADSSRIALSFFSKYCSKRLVYPLPWKYPERWLEWLLNELSKRQYDMVMPIGEGCFGLVSKNKQAIGQYTKVPVCDYAEWSRANDKAETLKLAIQQNIPCPKTRFIKDLSEIKQASEEISFPLIIKPRSSFGSRGIVYVERPSEFCEAYKKVHSGYPFPLIQEYIPPGGNACGVFLLFDINSEPKAVFAHKRLREFPLRGGPSTLRESIHAPELVEMSTKLLKALNWFGIAMVEYKEDPRDGQFKLMEINPRFWGSLPLAILAGVDFPYLLYKLVMEGDIDPVFEYPEGIRCRWFLPGDILHFLSNPERFKLQPSFFEFSKNNWNDDFVSLSDPGPAFGFFLILLKNLFNIQKWKHVFFR
jgi:predicted ATP-grasp superfamily ATP-dependent carboligase